MKIFLNQRMAYATPRNPAEKLKLYTKYFSSYVFLIYGGSVVFFFFAYFSSFCFGPFIFLPINEQVSTANVIIDWDVKIIMKSELINQRHTGWWSSNAFDLHSKSAKIEHWPENWLHWKFHRHPLSFHVYAEMVPPLGQHRFLPRTFPRHNSSNVRHY